MIQKVTNILKLVDVVPVDWKMNIPNIVTTYSSMVVEIKCHHRHHQWSHLVKGKVVVASVKDAKRIEKG